MNTLVPSRIGPATREMQQQLDLASRVVDWLARRGFIARDIRVSTFSSKPLIEIDPPRIGGALQGTLTIERTDLGERRYFTSAVNGCVVQWKA